MKTNLKNSKKNKVKRIIILLMVMFLVGCTPHGSYVKRELVKDEHRIFQKKLNTIRSDANLGGEIKSIRDLYFDGKKTVVADFNPYSKWPGYEISDYVDLKTNSIYFEVSKECRFLKENGISSLNLVVLIDGKFHKSYSFNWLLDLYFPLIK